MAHYSNEEYADILYCYGLSDGNSLQARREYHLRFPNRRLPSHRVFAAAYQRVRETGSVHERRRKAGKGDAHLAEDLDPELKEEPSDVEEDEVPAQVSAKTKRKLRNSAEAIANKKHKTGKKAAADDSFEVEEVLQNLQNILDEEITDTDKNDDSLKVNTSAKSDDSEKE
ncbi:46 kDa FK506-binding nuclear protein-like isoform X2 [Battus philenor]|uniref:46 kDa FK506-binding nuclear protein-like isoform X2 n=1 Tax=Battus philenor TaxID=42288 RepID=UPI0035D12FB8